MKIFCFFGLFALSLANAGSVQDVYNKGTNEIVDSNLYILFLIILVAMITIFLISIKRCKKTIQNYAPATFKPMHMRKINYYYPNSKKVDGDLLARLEINFEILHIKAAERSSKVIFSFGDYPRYFNADYENISNLLFSLCDFAIDITHDAVIKICVEPISTQNELYRFFVDIYKSLTPHEQNIVKTLEGQHTNIVYKKLSMATDYEEALSTKINFKILSKKSVFYFDANLKKIEQKPKYRLQNSGNKELRSVIVEDEINAFALLNKQLRDFGISTQPASNLDIAIKHIKSAIFKPDFVFINAKILSAMSREEVKELLKYKKSKEFCLIFVSDNASYDKYFDLVSKESCCYALRQPYIIDELLALLNKIYAEMIFLR